MYSIDYLQILLIEDNPGDARLIQEYLKEPTITFQSETVVCKNLKSGIQRLKKGQYDIVLLDLSLPDSSGLETLEKVKSFAGTSPIVVLTGLEDEKIGFNTVQKGAQDFLNKKEINATFLGRSILYAIQRKKVDKQLKENERRYRMLFQATTDEILVLQVDDNRDPLPFMEVNDIACDILGYSREELLQKTLYDIVAADSEEIKKRIDDVIKYGAWVHNSKHIQKGGDSIPLEVSARSFLYEGRQTIISVGRDIRARQQLEQEILNISERERQRIGRDMHDDLGQMLTGIGMIAQNLAKRLEANKLPAAESVQQIAAMVKEADKHARSLSHGLVPINLESNGLDTALRELTRNTSKMYDMDIHFRGDQDQDVIDSPSAVHLYRIAQEAINNAVKHGNPTAIDVALSTYEDYITLRIKDNGKGFSESQTKGDGMGIRIMHFRANIIGGNLEINTEKSAGTEIICNAPIKNNLS